MSHSEFDMTFKSLAEVVQHLKQLTADLKEINFNARRTVQTMRDIRARCQKQIDTVQSLDRIRWKKSEQFPH